MAGYGYDYGYGMQQGNGAAYGMQQPNSNGYGMQQPNNGYGMQQPNNGYGMQQQQQPSNGMPYGGQPMAQGGYAQKVNPSQGNKGYTQSPGPAPPQQQQMARQASFGGATGTSGYAPSGGGFGSLYGGMGGQNGNSGAYGQQGGFGSTYGGYNTSSMYGGGARQVNAGGASGYGSFANAPNTTGSMYGASYNGSMYGGGGGYGYGMGSMYGGGGFGSMYGTQEEPQPVVYKLFSSRRDSKRVMGSHEFPRRFDSFAGSMYNYVELGNSRNAPYNNSFVKRSEEDEEYERKMEEKAREIRELEEKNRALEKERELLKAEQDARQMAEKERRQAREAADRALKASNDAATARAVAEERAKAEAKRAAEIQRAADEASAKAQKDMEAQSAAQRAAMTAEAKKREDDLVKRVKLMQQQALSAAEEERKARADAEKKAQEALARAEEEQVARELAQRTAAESNETAAQALASANAASLAAQKHSERVSQELDRIKKQMDDYVEAAKKERMAREKAEQQAKTAEERAIAAAGVAAAMEQEKKARADAENGKRKADELAARELQLREEAQRNADQAERLYKEALANNAQSHEEMEKCKRDAADALASAAEAQNALMQFNNEMKLREERERIALEEAQRSRQEAAAAREEAANNRALIEAKEKEAEEARLLAEQATREREEMMKHRNRGINIPVSTRTGAAEHENPSVNGTFGDGDDTPSANEARGNAPQANARRQRRQRSGSKLIIEDVDIPVGKELYDAMQTDTLEDPLTVESIRKQQELEKKVQETQEEIARKKKEEERMREEARQKRAEEEARARAAEAEAKKKQDEELRRRTKRRRERAKEQKRVEAERAAQQKKDEAAKEDERIAALLKRREEEAAAAAANGDSRSDDGQSSSSRGGSRGRRRRVAPEHRAGSSLREIPEQPPDVEAGQMQDTMANELARPQSGSSIDSRGNRRSAPHSETHRAQQQQRPPPPPQQQQQQQPQESGEMQRDASDEPQQQQQGKDRRQQGGRDNRTVPNPMTSVVLIEKTPDESAVNVRAVNDESFSVGDQVYNATEVVVHAAGTAEAHSKIITKAREKFVNGYNLAMLSTEMSSAGKFTSPVWNQVMRTVQAIKQVHAVSDVSYALAYLTEDKVRDLLRDGATFEPIAVHPSPIFGPRFDNVEYHTYSDFANFDAHVRDGLMRASQDAVITSQRGIVVCFIIARRPVVTPDRTVDVVMSSALFSFSDSDAWLYEGVVTKALPALRPVFHFALGGPCASVAVFNMCESDVDVEAAMRVQRRMMAQKNYPLRSGSVRRFLMYIMGSQRKSMEKLETVTDENERQQLKKTMAEQNDLLNEGREALRQAQGMLQAHGLEYVPDELLTSPDGNQQQQQQQGDEHKEL